ncbi:hypothetical protein BCR33DRAFT_804110 [Rhizoclosmatium globosum]|uniref:Uncharacterized protein n=1 Tax=Rhizoclosmatium globosum TaxID=329046 RepID=A0A1Y2CP17_9FUNG|nr:hypothetical protein BCR33DRAFT_804110 [Rhizoclosmatium globosum]|eukprot:ORY48707.1 hypothetical protein BCR33DRAFT_804110 [Rhizoclosmatium globosum]
MASILHKVNMEKADPHFVIISRYGIAAAILFFILTGFAICYSSIDNELYFILISFTLTAIYVTLGAMKVALRKDKDRETAEKKGKRDTAVRMSEGKSTTLWTQTTVVLENDEVDDLIRRVS